LPAEFYSKSFSKEFLHTIEYNISDMPSISSNLKC